MCGQCGNGDSQRDTQTAEQQHRQLDKQRDTDRIGTERKTKTAEKIVVFFTSAKSHFIPLQKAY